MLRHLKTLDSDKCTFTYKTNATITEITTTLTTAKITPTTRPTILPLNYNFFATVRLSNPYIICCFSLLRILINSKFRDKLQVESDKSSTASIHVSIYGCHEEA